MKRVGKLFYRFSLALYWWSSPATILAQNSSAVDSSTMRDTGISGIWMLANISYAGMRAQGSQSTGWRIVAFIFGFPGTLITFLAVQDGGGRAYGIELPGPRNNTSS